MVKISEVINIYTLNKLNEFIKKYTGLTLEEDRLELKDIQKNWKFLGNNSSNASAVGILTKGEKGLVERITNAIDAVIEKQKIVHNISTAKNADVIIKKAFPKYYQNKIDVAKGLKDKCKTLDADGQVVLAINDSDTYRKPTFDVIDKGTGIEGKDFANTILSIQKGNKLSSDKGYLIGAFGQGGSTSLPFTEATIIISKFENKFYFTVIKSVELQDYKNHCYVYMTIDGKIPELQFDTLTESDYVNSFLDSESGTLVRMIETDISKNLRDNEITKPGMLGDYINTELYNVGLPVTLIDKRANFQDNAHKQNRSSYGTYSKLQTWKAYVKKDYCGSIDIDINGQIYKVEYYTILPSNEDNWGKDSEAKNTFVQFNSYLDPIIYTVNGQTITSESFVKLKNAGLNFLKYRLLVVINLDNLGMEKYKFFTTDRNHIKETDRTKGFLNKVVNTLANVDKLKEINSIIAEKAISTNIDNNYVSEISKEVKSLYGKYLKGTSSIANITHNHHYTPDDEDNYKNEITELSIGTTKNEFYCDQAINIILNTGAQKHVNKNEKIDAYIDGKCNYDFTAACMNGRIQFTWNAKSIKPGKHSIKFVYFRDVEHYVESNELAFNVLNEKAPENVKKEADKTLNLDIQMASEKELICDVSKNEETGLISIVLCLDHDEMTKEIYGHRSTAEKIKETQSKIIKPVVLFALFLGEKYDNLESYEDKNKIIISFVKSLIVSTEDYL